jgi:hypothetical protein
VTDEEWERLVSNFESREIFTVLDAIDELRARLRDSDRFAPAQIRNDVLELQDLCRRVTLEEDTDAADEMFI